MLDIGRSYESYLRSPEWQKKRAERLRIDQYKCQKCGRPIDLQVHHLNYDNIGNEDVYADLITLCKYCHKEIEDAKEEYKLAYRRNYRDEYVSARKLELKFCHDYSDLDISAGGPYNMLNFDVARAEWTKWLKANAFSDRGLRVTTVTNYFRDMRIKIILSMSAAGASPDEIMAKGISGNMVRKYYNNSELANAVLKNSLEDYYDAET